MVVPPDYLGKRNSRSWGVTAKSISLLWIDAVYQLPLALFGIGAAISAVSVLPVKVMHTPDFSYFYTELSTLSRSEISFRVLTSASLPILTWYSTIALLGSGCYVGIWLAGPLINPAVAVMYGRIVHQIQMDHLSERSPWHQID